MNYLDAANSPFLYVLGGIVTVFVLVQSTVFLIRAWKQGLRMGMDRDRLKTVVRSSAFFSIVPSIPILLGVFSMMKALGIPVPWIRLSVIGSVSYELIAAENAAATMGLAGGLNDPGFTMDHFTGVLWVMTIGIIWGLVYCVFFLRGYMSRMNRIQTTNRKWGELLVGSLFMGMVAAFTGYLISPQLLKLFQGAPLYEGLTPLLTLITSVLFMAGFTWIIKKSSKSQWLEGFAMPLSMVMAMAMAIYYSWLMGGML